MTAFLSIVCHLTRQVRVDPRIPSCWYPLPCDLTCLVRSELSRDRFGATCRHGWLEKLVFANDFERRDTISFSFEHVPRRVRPCQGAMQTIGEEDTRAICVSVPRFLDTTPLL